MKTLLLKTLFATLAMIGFSHGLSAQEKPASAKATADKVEKTTETFNVDEGVLVKVDGSFTNFIFKTWNKGQVLVESFIETEEDLTKEEKQQLLENWDLSILGNSGEIHISSNGGASGFLNSFVFSSNGHHGFVDPQSLRVVAPMPPSISLIQVPTPPSPPLPPSFYENMGQLQFDYEAYKKNGEDYIKEYQKQIEEKFGKDFRKDMKKYAEEISKRMEELREKREALLEKRRKSMEERRREIEQQREEMEEHRKEMMAQMKNMNQRMQIMVDINAGATDGKSAKTLKEWAENNPNAKYSKKVTVGPNGEKIVSWSFSDSSSWSSKNNGKKTVVVHLPEDAKLNLEIRHGKVNLEGKTSNLRASLSHTPFIAEEISGEETEITLSYAPVKIENWENGFLSLSYIRDGVIESARNLKLASNMSNLTIGNIEESGLLRGSFGELTIEKVGEGFKSLNIDLQNSQLKLQLPDTAFDFDYDGEHSQIQLPASLEVESRENHGQKFISGHKGSESNSGRIMIEADFSEVKITD